MNYDRSVANGNYNGLQAHLERRFTGWLTSQVSYTWSKSIDAGSSGFFGVEGQQIQDPYNVWNSRSVSAYDIPHVLTVSLNYELPIGKGKAFFKRAIAAGHEGIVAKRINSRYLPNKRNGAWQKIKQRMLLACVDSSVLTIAAVRYDGQGRARKGVCSPCLATYRHSRQPGTEYHAQPESLEPGLLRVFASFQ
jgi:hypothetical protein